LPFSFHSLRLYVFALSRTACFLEMTMIKNRDDITPLTNRNAATPPSRDRVGQRVNDHYQQAAAAIRSAPRQDTVRRITVPAAHPGRMAGALKQR
jgi:hypothetical protein